MCMNKGILAFHVHHTNLQRSNVHQYKAVNSVEEDTNNFPRKVAIHRVKEDDIDNFNNDELDQLKRLVEENKEEWQR